MAVAETAHAKAIRLLEQALFLRMYGERPPGAPHDRPEAETWQQWERDAEVFLRRHLDTGGYAGNTGSDVGR